MGLMFILGLVLSIYSFKISYLTTKCEKRVQDSSRGLLVMSIIIVSVSATFMVCGCNTLGKNVVLGRGFTALMLMAGITVIVLSSIIHNNCKKARKDTPILITLAVITTAVALINLSYKLFSKAKLKDD